MEEDFLPCTAPSNRVQRRTPLMKACYHCLDPTDPKSALRPLEMITYILVSVLLSDTLKHV